ncbi:MAG: hypothetical protein M3Q24_02685 [bacterium]|nr:hypothetical protein [bacterium]
MKDLRKYIYAFLITALIFGTAIYASNRLGNKKLAEVRDIEDKLALDILSSETQFALLEETLCKDIGNTFLSKEVGNLADRLSYAESENPKDDPDVINLKRYYSLLEIKDYLLMKKITEKCGIKPTFILYFYSNEGDCEECTKTGYVLTALHEKYPDLRIYSFDYNLDLEAIKTLIAIYKVENTLPAVIINAVPYYGYRSLEELEETVPAIKVLETALIASTTKATTTPKKK